MTVEEIFRALAAASASTPPERETELLQTAGEIFVEMAGPAAEEILAGPPHDVAITCFLALLCDCGVLIGRSAPGQAPEDGAGIAQVWRVEDSNARVYRAATPGLALARAALSEAADREDARRRTQCATCRGLGWYVSAENARQICQHTDGPKGTSSPANAGTAMRLRRRLAN